MSFLPNSLIHVDTAFSKADAKTIIEAATFKLLGSFQTAHPITAALIDNAIDHAETERMIAYNNHPDEADPYVASYLEPVNRVIQKWWAKHPFNAMFVIEPLQLDGFSNTQVVDRHYDQQFSVAGDPQYGPLSATCTAKGEVTYYLDRHDFNVFDPDSRETFKRERSILSRNPRPEEISVVAKPGSLLLIPTTTLHGATASEGRITEVDFSFIEPIMR